MRIPEILSRIAAMHLYSRKLADCAAAQTMSFNAALPGAPRPPNPTRAWGGGHDFRLLTGLLSQGFGHWREIALEERLALQPALRAELGQPAVGQAREPPPPPPPALQQQTLLGVSSADAEQQLTAEGSAPSMLLSPPPDPAAREAAVAAVAAAWRASLVQGLTPTEHNAQTNWLKKRVDYLRDAIHSDSFYPHGLIHPVAAPAPPQSMLQPGNMARLAGLVVVPAHAAGAARSAAEQFMALCGAAEGVRGDALLAWSQGRGSDDGAARQYGDSLAALTQQCRTLVAALEAQRGPPAAPEVIVLD
jgi:hypothetical protein